MVTKKNMYYINYSCTKENRKKVFYNPHQLYSKFQFTYYADIK